MSTLDIELFDPRLLREPASLATALDSISCSVRNAAEATLELLLSRPHLVEFVWSAIDNETSDWLISWVMNYFPISSVEFLDSITSKLLARLSLSMLDVAHLTSAPDLVEKCRLDVELRLPVLQALSLLVSSENIPSESHAWRDGEKFMHPRDIKAFQNLKLPIPAASSDVERLSFELLCEMKDILEYYFDILRRPELAVTFTQSYIPPVVDLITTDSLGDDSEAPASNMEEHILKAPWHFDSIAGFGEWRVLISGSMKKDLREARRSDGAMFKVILKKIRDLSKGHFSADNQYHLAGSTSDVPIHAARMTGNTRLVYQVDCVIDSESGREMQVLRMFGVYTLARLDRAFWDSVSKQISKRGKTYKSKCKARKKCGPDLSSPLTFPEADEESPAEAPSYISTREQDFDKIHSLLLLDKFFSLSQALLTSIWVDLDVTHVFEVSPRETEIINNTSSCYVIGRSGTGKTTAMVFKMLKIEGSWKLSAQAMPKPRQMFVTQSPVLADKVEKYFSKLSESLEIARLSPKELKKLASTRLSSEDDTAYFVHPDDQDLEDSPSNLPKKFGLLQDEHFPMFITFNRLSALLEADMGVPDSVAPSNRVLSKHWMRQATTSSGDYMQQTRTSFISYGTFLESYWYHFPQRLTKGLDPSLVFGEIMGVIKGSEQTLNLPEHYLDRETYTNLSRRAHPTFASQRDDVYDLFESYLNLKRDRRERDAADRTHAIIQHIRENGLLGHKIDYLYVDEIQDNLLIDSLLLRSITRNGDGLFWAGDTAQTISVGKTFRFEDLKAFQYRIEDQTDRRHNHFPAAMPKVFQLLVNYRSHAGIANCAHSVIELLEKYWPKSLDKLAAEQGVVDGRKPIFFTHNSLENFQFEQLTFGDSNVPLEFGHEQCILVRHDAAKKALKRQLGNAAVILTIYDSKGSEFDDVLLWNFFEDSTASLSQWRIVLNEAQTSHINLPSFDENKHAMICSELKSLYVGITRSRKRLWVFDQSEKAEPMRIYWTSKGRVENCDFSPADLRPRVTSSPEEWAQRAKNLFYNKNFSEAAQSFRKACRYREADIADAYDLREKARLTKSSNVRMKAYRLAAKAFLECAKNTDSEKQEQRQKHLKVAGDCWKHAFDFVNAAVTYMKASKYGLCVDAYRQAENFDEAVEVANKHSKDIEPGEKERLRDEASKFYFRRGELDKGRALYASDESALKFMKKHGFNELRLSLLKLLNKTAEIAELLYEMNRFGEASQYVLAELWDRISFGNSYKSDIVLSKLLKVASGLQTKKISRTERDEIAMFRYITCSKLAKLHELRPDFHESSSAVYAFLCFDHGMSLFTAEDGTTYNNAVSILRLSSRYYRHLSINIDSDSGLIADHNYQRLFGFQCLEKNVVLPRKTFLYRSVSQNNQLSKKAHKDGFLIADTDFPKFFASALSQRTKLKISGVLERVQKYALSLSFITGKKCGQVPCDSFCLHFGPDDATVSWYNVRMEFFMLQCRMLQILSPVERFTRERALICKLYNVSHPPIHNLGSLANVEYLFDDEKGLMAIKESIRSVCMHPTAAQPQNESYDAHFLTNFMKTITLAFTFDRKGASAYITTLSLRNGGFVADKFISSLRGNSQTCIFDGLDYLRYILSQRVLVGIDVICGFLDFLCGFIIISRRFRRGKSLHNAILPRSWFTLLCPFFDKLWDKYRPQEVDLLLEIAHDLLARLYTITPNDDSFQHLIYDGRTLPAHEDFSSIRDLFVSRICRSIGLLSCNIQAEKIRQEIYDIVTSLRNGDVPLCNPYVLAEHPDELCSLVLKSTEPFLDEMICLCHAARKGKEHASNPENVNFVEYRNVEDIRSLFAIKLGKR